MPTTDTTTSLRSLALQGVAAVDPNGAGGHKLRAIKWVHDAIKEVGEERLPLPEIARAVDWALAQPRDFSPYLTDSIVATNWSRYVFPNGRAASVILDPHYPFRFEVEYDGEDGRFVAPGLSTSEVEAKLAEVAALPAVEADVARAEGE